MMWFNKIKFKWKKVECDDGEFWFHAWMVNSSIRIISKNKNSELCWDIFIDDSSQELFFELKSFRNYKTAEDAMLAVETAVTEWVNKFFQRVTYE